MKYFYGFSKLGQGYYKYKVHSINEISVGYVVRYSRIGNAIINVALCKKNGDHYIFSQKRLFQHLYDLYKKDTRKIKQTKNYQHHYQQYKNKYPEYFL